MPASRADIFKDRSLSPVDKRSLMRFLQKTQQSFLGQKTSLVRHYNSTPFCPSKFEPKLFILVEF